MLVTFSQRLTAILITISSLLLLRQLLQSHNDPLPSAFTRKYSFSQSSSSSSLNDDAAATATDSDYTPSNADKPAPRIRQVTVLDTSLPPKMLALQEHAIETHKRHGQRWGYPTDAKRKASSAQDYDEKLVKAMYMKSIIVAEMNKAAEKRAEWILWFDPQTVLLNPTIPLSLFLPPPDFPTIHALGTKDWAGFHTGVFFLRVHPWTLTMLNETIIYNRENDSPVGYGAAGGGNGFIWGFESPDYYEHMLYQPRQWYNAVPSIQHDRTTSRSRGGSRKAEGAVNPGSMLIHTMDTSAAFASGYASYYTGTESEEDVSSESTTKVLKHYLYKLQDSPHDFEVSLSSTPYISEVNDYWARARSTRKLLEEAEERLYRGETDDLEVEPLRQAEAEMYQTFWEYGHFEDGMRAQREKLEQVLQEL